MAANTFGIPITNEILKGMEQFHSKTITRKDRACVALQMKNSKGNGNDAFKFVNDLNEIQDKNDDKTDTTTRCLIYNATGDTIRLVNQKDWVGRIDRTPHPMIIQNGQWAAFLHRAPKTSKSAVVYAGKNDEDRIHHWMLSWCCNNTEKNQVYVETKEAGLFDESKWDAISNNLDKSGMIHQDEAFDCAIYASIGCRFQSVCEGIMTLGNAIDVKQP